MALNEETKNAILMRYYEIEDADFRNRLAHLAYTLSADKTKPDVFESVLWYFAKDENKDEFQKAYNDFVLFGDGSGIPTAENTEDMKTTNTRVRRSLSNE